MISHINFDLKVLGERSAGNPHATFDVAGVGNGKRVIKPMLHRANSRPYLRAADGVVPSAYSPL